MTNSELSDTSGYFTITIQNAIIEDNKIIGFYVNIGQVYSSKGVTIQPIRTSISGNNTTVYLNYNKPQDFVENIPMTIYIITSSK